MQGPYECLTYNVQAWRYRAHETEEQFKERSNQIIELVARFMAAHECCIVFLQEVEEMLAEDLKRHMTDRHEFRVVAHFQGQGKNMWPLSQYTPPKEFVEHYKQYKDHLEERVPVGTMVLVRCIGNPRVERRKLHLNLNKNKEPDMNGNIASYVQLHWGTVPDNDHSLTIISFHTHSTEQEIRDEEMLLLNQQLVKPISAIVGGDTNTLKLLEGEPMDHRTPSYPAFKSSPCTSLDTIHSIRGQLESLQVASAYSKNLATMSDHLPVHCTWCPRGQVECINSADVNGTQLLLSQVATATPSASKCTVL